MDEAVHLAGGEVCDPDLVQDCLLLTDVLIEGEHELRDSLRLKMGRGMLLTNYLLKMVGMDMHRCCQVGHRDAMRPAIP